MLFAAPPRPASGRARPWGARLTAALALGATFGAACGDSTGPRGNVDGTYSLTQVEGRSVPFRETIPGFGTLVINRGELTLDDGDYDLTVDAVVNGGDRSVDDVGTFSRDGDRIRLRSDFGRESYDGTFSDNNRALTVAVQGFALRFERD